MVKVLEALGKRWVKNEQIWSVNPSGKRDFLEYHLQKRLLLMTEAV